MSLKRDSQSVTPTANKTARSGKYLTFRMATEEYGLEILKVREIIGLTDITAVPRTPHYVRGVINLRGKVIPVIDLRAKFCMDSAEQTEETCIIVVEISGQKKDALMGLLVDAVSEVLDIQEDQIEDTPDLGSGINTRFILGIGKVKSEIKILLDIDSVLAEDDFNMIRHLSGKNSGQPAD